MAGENDTPAVIDGTFVPRLRAGVAAVPVGDEAVLYEEATGQLHQLNVTAAAVCDRLDGTTSISRVVRELSGAFAQDPATIETDVIALVRELAGKGLLQRPGAGEDGDTVTGGSQDA